MRSSAIKALLLGRLRTSFRDKGHLFWVFAWPVLLTLMTAYVFIPPSVGSPATFSVGVVNLDSSRAPINGSFLVDVLSNVTFNGTRVFNVKHYVTEKDLIDALREGKVAAGLIIPEGFGKNVTFGQARVNVLISASDPYSAQVREGILKAFFERFSVSISLMKVEMTVKYASKYLPANVTVPSRENESLKELIREWMLGIAAPLNASFKEVLPKAVNSRPAWIGFYTLGAVGMVMLYGGFMVGANLIHEDRERGTLERILSTPTSIWELFTGRVLAGLTELGLMGILVIASGYLLGARICWDPFQVKYWLVPFNFLVIGITTIGIGVLIAVPARTASGASSLAISLGLVLAFLTGVWFPKDWLPSPLRLAADWFPVTVSLDSVRNIMVWGRALADVLIPSAITAAFGAAVITLSALVYGKLLRGMME